MTKLEFEEFFLNDLKGRWPKWDPTPAMLEDWFSILRYHTPDVAKQAIQEHRLGDKSTRWEPQLRDVKKRLWQLSKRAGSDDVLGTTYFAYVRCLEPPAGHPEWQDEEWLSLERFERSRATDKRYVASYAERRAAAVQQEEGGRWCGVVRPDGQMPPGFPTLEKEEARQCVEQHCRNGPNTAARRYLLGASGSMRPVLKTVESVAKREIDKAADELNEDRWEFG